MGTTFKINGYPARTPELANIPHDLRDCPWALWKAKPREGKPGKYDKVPQHPISNQNLKTNQPATWATFAQVKQAFESGGWSGIGILMTGDGLIGWDIDNLSATFEAQPLVKAWVSKVAQAGGYIEVSPSGDGLRGFLRGEFPVGGYKKGLNIEIYPDVRFLTVTGNLWEGE